MWKYAPLWTPKKIKKANKYWFKYLESNKCEEIFKKDSIENLLKKLN